MVDFVRERLGGVADLCQRYRVKTQELFGSAFSGDFDPETSDLDFLVEFLPKAEPGSTTADYFGLLDGLEAIFTRPVDLVEKRVVKNPYFIRAVRDAREQIYAA